MDGKASRQNSGQLGFSRFLIVNATLALQNLGYLLGLTSGLNFAAALAIAVLNPTAVVATILPD